jgi:hypothetical protein
MGEPGDISLGGLRVRNLLPVRMSKVSDHLGLLLMDREDALSLRGEVVHHGTVDTSASNFVIWVLPKIAASSSDYPDAQV